MSNSILYRQLFHLVFKDRSESDRYLLRAPYSPGSSLSLQDLASVCEGQDPLHLHVLCRQCWTDRSVSCSCEQDPSTNGSNDERILAGKLYNSNGPNRDGCVCFF